MSLTLLWNGATHFFESHAKARDAVHHNTRLEHRITKHIYVLRAGILGAEPTTPIILKIARDAGEIAALENEASMYQDQLKSLQGKYVPRFYGIYHGDVEGTPVACMLLEYCVEGKYKLSACEMNRKVMLAACAIHTGIMHCDLENGHHFVRSGPDIKIVDFSCAVPHRCYGATPTLHPGMGGPSGPAKGCRELVMLEENYGIFSGNSLPIVNAPVVNPLAEGNPLSVLARRFVGMMM